MEGREVQAAGGGCGIGGISLFLTVVFVALKTSGTVDWSWWWVFSPLWITFILFLGAVFFIALLIITLTLVEVYKARR